MTLPVAPIWTPCVVCGKKAPHLAGEQPIHGECREFEAKQIPLVDPGRNVYHGHGWELHAGRWQDVLPGFICDAVITDPPYSPRTHNGYRSGSDVRKSSIDYRPWSREECAEFIDWATSAARWWIVAFGDHETVDWMEKRLHMHDWYPFAPLPWVKPDAPPRMSADGPASSAEWIKVARRKIQLPRPRKFSKPGHYVHNSDHGRGVVQTPIVGSKPIDLMRAIVRDYTRPGDVIIDPFAGGGSTLIASVLEGRTAIGVEEISDRAAFAARQCHAGSGQMALGLQSAASAAPVEQRKVEQGDLFA
jgi:site-specific DNA-methyltransferase (adenine-specific)